jgi:Spy/CpxP family protein refolding chaperone
LTDAQDGTVLTRESTGMRQKFSIRLWIMGILLILGLLLPGSGWAQKAGALNTTEQREQLLKDLNLTSDKAKAFMSVGGHWDQIRQDLIADIKKNETDLETALAAPRADDNTINRLVNGLIAEHDQLFETFKSQRQEEMATLTPVQRGKFLLALKKWHEEQCAASNPRP